MGSLFRGADSGQQKKGERVCVHIFAVGGHYARAYIYGNHAKRVLRGFHILFAFPVFFSLRD